MTLTVEITPSSESTLSRLAAEEGIEVEAYAAHLLEQAALASDEQMRKPQPLESTLREVAQFSYKIPALPDRALSREAIYREDG